MKIGRKCRFETDITAKDHLWFFFFEGKILLLQSIRFGFIENTLPIERKITTNTIDTKYGGKNIKCFNISVSGNSTLLMRSFHEKWNFKYIHCILNTNTP